MLAISAMDPTLVAVFGIVGLVCFALAALSVVAGRVNLVAAGLFFVFVPIVWNNLAAA